MSSSQIKSNTMSITWKSLYEECERKGYYVPHSTKEKCYMAIRGKINRIMYNGYNLDDYNTDWTYKAKPVKTGDLTEQARKLGFIIPIRKENIQLYNKMKYQMHHILNGKFTLDDLNTDWSKKKIIRRKKTQPPPYEKPKRKKKRNVKLVIIEEDEKSKFLYPERCQKFWNVQLQKDEWKQYLGAGHFCEPELK